MGDGQNGEAAMAACNPILSPNAFSPFSSVAQCSVGAQGWPRFGASLNRLYPFTGAGVSVEWT